MGVVVGAADAGGVGCGAGVSELFDTPRGSGAFVSQWWGRARVSVPVCRNGFCGGCR